MMRMGVGRWSESEEWRDIIIYECLWARRREEPINELIEFFKKEKKEEGEEEEEDPMMMMMMWVRVLVLMGTECSLLRRQSIHHQSFVHSIILGFHYATFSLYYYYYY